MTAKLDFTLSNRFGIVERTIFRLVVSGVNEIKTITELLSVYSDEVIANALKKLVNFQILHADLDNRTLSVSEPMLAIIDGCIEHSKSLELPDGLSWEKEQYEYITQEDIKREILGALLPGVNVGFLAKSLDFVVCDRGVQDEQ